MHSAYILEYSAYILEHSAYILHTFWNTLVHSAYILEHSEMFWNFVLTFWDILEHYADILELSETLCIHSGSFCQVAGLVWSSLTGEVSRGRHGHPVVGNLSGANLRRRGQEPLNLAGSSYLNWKRGLYCKHWISQQYSLEQWTYRAKTQYRWRKWGRGRRRQRLRGADSQKATFFHPVHWATSWIQTWN